MIRATIRRHYASHSGDRFTDVDEWQLETDAPYNPDAAQDLAGRVHELWAACRSDERAAIADDLEADQ